MKPDFLTFCESLWADWLGGRLETSAFIRDRFDVNAAPEPYLSFNAGKRPLIALLTNPGNTMAHQKRFAVRRGNGPLSTSMRYADAAVSLGRFYQAELKRAARERIDALVHLSQLAGFDGVLCVESCPFHSKSLPGKKLLLQAYRDDPFLAEYSRLLRALLKDRPVVIVSATSTRQTQSARTKLSQWLTWQADLAGLRIDRAEFVSLIIKGRKTTCAAFVDKAQGGTKSLVLMMGGNRLPGEQGRCKLAQALSAQSNASAK